MNIYQKLGILSKARTRGIVKYVNGRDPSMWDFGRENLIADNVWHELDLSDIVPVGGADQLVHLLVEIEAQIAKKEISFASIEHEGECNRVKLLTQMPYISNTKDAMVKMDSGRKIKYRMDSEGVVGLHTYARWRLNESSGITASDDSGHARDGTLMNMENADWVSGMENNCLKFDGTNEFVDCGDIANFERTDSFSVEFWFKTNNMGSQDIINRMLPAQPYTGWAAYMSEGQIQFYLIATHIGNKFIQITVNENFADNEWHHLLITYDGSSLASGVHIYIDDVDKILAISRDTLTASILNITNCRIAARDRSIVHFDGLLDEVTIYDIELPDINDAWLMSRILVRGWFEI